MHNTFHKIIEFIRKIYQTKSGFIPLHAPVFNGNEKVYLNDCVDSTYVSSIGDYVDKFENKISEYTGTYKAVACVNGTNALHVALRMSGVNEDSEVITQPLTFVATANAISYCNAHPVFVDVDTETLGMSVNSLYEFLNKHTISDAKNNKRINKYTKRKISAVLPVHTFGYPCKIESIAEICREFRIPLIEDAAESLGSFYKKKHTGIFGDIGVLSFNGNKVITTGGGGMLLFNNEVKANVAKHLTTQAKVAHPWEFIHDTIGYNYRLPNINAAIGLAQLEQLPGFLKNKRETANLYMGFFKNTPWKFVKEPENSQSNYWLNCLLFDNLDQRNKFLQFSNEKGVMTRPAWTLMNNLPMYKNSYKLKLLNAEYISDRLVNLPSSIRPSQTE